MRNSGLIDPQGNAIPSTLTKPNRQQMMASYDVINNWDDDNHWQYAQSYSQDRLDTFAVRQQLRNAARYEYRNNSYCRGLVVKMATEVVGTGPTIEVEAMAKSKAAKDGATKFERFWNEQYAKEIKLVENLVMGIVEKIVAGEIFYVFRPNPNLDTVTVDFKAYEGEQFHTPHRFWRDIWADRPWYPVDGIEFDEYGNIEAYLKLQHHPHGQFPSVDLYDVDRLSPRVVAHLYRKDRPSMYRGVSELTPAIHSLKRLRRYTEATLQTAENQASLTGALRTNAPPEYCAGIGTDPIELTIGNGTFINLPEGWMLDLLKGEAPAQGYAEFKREILHEIISSLLMPWNVASGDSSEYNFASGRLDYMVFYRMIDTIRQQIEDVLLNRFFSFWADFAEIQGFVPSALGAYRWKWYWPQREPIDITKQANADATLKKANLLDESAYWQRQNISMEDAIRRNVKAELLHHQIRKQMAEEMEINLAELNQQQDDSKPAPTNGRVLETVN